MSVTTQIIWDSGKFECYRGTMVNRTINLNMDKTMWTSVGDD